MTCRVQVSDTTEEAVRQAAEAIVRILRDAIEERGWASLALAGGRTPRPLYLRLAQSPYRTAVQWECIEWFWSDERPVPPDHPDSNYRLAVETLFSRITPPASRIHRLLTELDPREATPLYEATIRRVFGVDPTGIPRFDLILLGMGADGHIASLFPGTAALEEQQRLVVPNEVPQLQAIRLTFAPPLLRAARAVLVLVTGEEKAPAVRDALEGPMDPKRHPAHLLRQVDGPVLWILDRAAASQLVSHRESCGSSQPNADLA